MERHDVVLNGEEQAIGAATTPVEHLPEGDAEKVGFLFGHGTSFGHRRQPFDGFLQGEVSALGRIRRPFGKPEKRLQGVGPCPCGDDAPVSHRGFFASRI